MSIKKDKSGQDVATLTQVSLPKPIRKRGHYRALKRREAWALMDNMLLKMMNDLASDLFGIPKP